MVSPYDDKPVQVHDTPDWPLTIASARLTCAGNAVLLHAAGKTYWLTGPAHAASPRLPSIDPIWRKDPSVPGARVDIGGLIASDLRLR